VSEGYTVPVFYDSLIAKLVAWAASRDEAIARMTRALREYQVLGIRTTIPFFLWLMKQPEYREGRYDTTYLDRLLAERKGSSFSELSDSESDLAIIAAAVDVFMRTQESASPTTAVRSSQWLEAARREALRG
jgi:acetyl-CoA carboxylase biotin carboxylase subunit